MNNHIKEIRKKLSEHGYNLFYLDPYTFDSSVISELIRCICNKVKAKTIIYYWRWTEEEMPHRQMINSQISIAGALEDLVEKNGGKWYENWWEITEMVRRLEE